MDWGSTFLGGGKIPSRFCEPLFTSLQEHQGVGLFHLECLSPGSPTWSSPCQAPRSSPVSFTVTPRGRHYSLSPCACGICLLNGVRSSDPEASNPTTGLFLLFSILKHSPQCRLEPTWGQTPARSLVSSTSSLRVPLSLPHLNPGSPEGTDVVRHHSPPHYITGVRVTSLPAHWRFRHVTHWL